MKENNFRQGRYFPFENPFINKPEAYTANQIIKTRITQKKFFNPDTGKMIDIPIIHVIEEEDEQNFVKIFAAGIQAIFDLSRTGYRALVLALQTYHSNQDNNDGSITLIWYNGGVNGQKLDMTDRTFYGGLRELIQKGILKPKLPNQYWVNPILFFKSDQITFLKEYQKKPSSAKLDIPSDGHQTDLENFIKK
ncbi:hypothetical protein NPX99_07890 [Bartonella sp. 220]|uniref:hypothetical protein n=1 Tax=Bartonella sp. 220B TaxID=2967260 RepID=UPI0022A96710|nr:hypothetical protein [Bartonella sp. 220B]MCZ2159165.1 hypothetical protein [Bartonella sp. 220B]